MRGRVSKIVRSFGASWGKIRPEGESRDLFFNASTLVRAEDYYKVVLGQAVEFDEEPELFVVETGRYLTEIQRQAQSWVLPSAPSGVEPRPGIHVLASSGGAAGRRVAVNVNMEESNPAPISHDEFLAAVPRVARTAQPDEAAEARTTEDDQRLWQWGLLMMFAALAGEGLVGRRAT